MEEYNSDLDVWLDNSIQPVDVNLDIPVPVPATSADATDTPSTSSPLWLIVYRHFQFWELLNAP